jgi:hypothetical protein
MKQKTTQPPADGAARTRLTFPKAIAAVAKFAAGGDSRPLLARVTIDRVRNMAYAADGYIMAVLPLGREDDPTPANAPDADHRKMWPYATIPAKPLASYARKMVASRSRDGLSGASLSDDADTLFMRLPDDTTLMIDVEERDEIGGFRPEAVFPPEDAVDQVWLGVDLTIKMLQAAKAADCNFITIWTHGPEKPLEIAGRMYDEQGAYAGAFRALQMPVVAGGESPELLPYMRTQEAEHKHG